MKKPEAKKMKREQITIAQTVLCIVCGKKAVTAYGHVHLKQGIVSAGRCRKHATRGGVDSVGNLCETWGCMGRLGRIVESRTLVTITISSALPKSERLNSKIGFVNRPRMFNKAKRFGGFVIIGKKQKHKRSNTGKRS